MWFTIVALVAAALGLAAWRPLLIRSRGERAGRLALLGEVVLGATVVLAAATLTASVPSIDVLGQVQPVYAETALTSDASVTFRASPGKIGSNDFSIVVAPIDPSFSPPPKLVTLVFEPGGEQLELRTSGPADPWTFRGAGEQLNASGSWTVTAQIAWPNQTPEPVAFAVDAAGSGLYPSGVARPVGTHRTGVLFLGFGWIVAGLALGLAARRVHSREATLGWGLLALAGMAVLLGGALLVAGNVVA